MSKFELDEVLKAFTEQVKCKLVKFHEYAANPEKLVSEDFYTYEMLDILINQTETHDYKYETEHTLRDTGGRAVDLLFVATKSDLKIHVEFKLAGKNDIRLLKDLIKLQYIKNHSQREDQHCWAVVISHNKELNTIHPYRLLISEINELEHVNTEINTEYLNTYYRKCKTELQNLISLCNSLCISKCSIKRTHKCQHTNCGSCLDDMGKVKGVSVCSPFVVCLLKKAGVSALQYRVHQFEVKIPRAKIPKAEKPDGFSVYIYCFELMRSSQSQNIDNDDNTSIY